MERASASSWSRFATCRLLSYIIIRSYFSPYRRLLDEKNKTQADYDFACDLARRLIDRIEDNTIATGLQLYGVNRLTWRATAECLGVQDIQRRCEDYLNHHEEDFYF